MSLKTLNLSFIRKKTFWEKEKCWLPFAIVLSRLNPLPSTEYMFIFCLIFARSEIRFPLQLEIILSVIQYQPVRHRIVKIQDQDQTVSFLVLSDPDLRRPQTLQVSKPSVSGKRFLQNICF